MRLDIPPIPLNDPPDSGTGPRIFNDDETGTKRVYDKDDNLIYDGPQDGYPGGQNSNPPRQPGPSNQGGFRPRVGFSPGVSGLLHGRPDGTFTFGFDVNGPVGPRPAGMIVPWDQGVAPPSTLRDLINRMRKPVQDTARDAVQRQFMDTKTIYDNNPNLRPKQP